ncbi:hypothetical protein LTR85_002604 [Meristemomyces frigidus]|nr:hypothetical protein LTR85_002604 [Meristemomyces frigidus]
MSRVTTRARVKQELVEDHYEPAAATPAPPTPAPPSRPISVSSTMTAIGDPHVGSSGDTVRDEDTDMDMDGTYGRESVPAVNGINGMSAASSPNTVHTPNGVGLGHPTDSVEDNRSASEDAMHTLGSKSRALIKVIQKLETLDIDATLPSLPKFVVVGDQSQGKSSIIEAICNVQLPRGPGTCTRCPYQITTSASKSTGNDSWSCKISLHRKYSYDPKYKARSQTTYDRWVEEDSLNSCEFITIHDKDQLEDVLKRAQLAILNPSTNPEYFLHAKMPATASLQVGFSPNVVSLEIEGPDLPELSFFDLPGAINVHPDASEQYLVPFIGKLIRNYLRDDKALVLLACSADQDVENSTAFGFVGQCGAQGRCMGVITKPDLLGRSKHPYIRQILNGEKFTLSNGWFVTKQTSTEELDNGQSITHAEARQREHAFFGQAPWATSFAAYGDHFGIHNLQDSISNKLTAHILHDLPEILARVEDRLDEIAVQLAEFPEQPQSAAHTVMDEAQSVTHAILAHIRGDGLDNKFRSDYKQLIRVLRKQLLDLRPHVVLRTPGYVKPAIEVDSDDEPDPTPTPARTYSPLQTPSKMRRGMNGQPIPSSARAAMTETPRKTVKAEHSDQALTRCTFTLDKLKLSLDRGSNSGLPDQVDPKVTEHFIKQSLAGWRGLVTTLLGKVQQQMAGMLKESIDDSLSTRRQTQLYIKVTEAIDAIVTDALRAQSNVIVHLVDCETYKPITYNPNLRQLTEQAKSKLKTDRRIERVDEYCDALDAKGVKVPTAQERAKKLEELESKMGADKYGREVAAMATPLAYYDLASARMLDNIATHLECGLMGALEANLRNALRASLRVTDEGYCVQLLAEDPEREKMRMRLLGEREKLGIALEELRGWPHRSTF